MWWWHFVVLRVCGFGVKSIVGRGCDQLVRVCVVIWVECENSGYSRLFPPRNSRIGVEGRPRLGMCRVSWLFVRAV